MNPYIFLRELNSVIRQRGLDIRVLEVKYLQSKTKAQKGFELSDVNRYAFQVDKTKNNVFGTDNQFLDWIFTDSVKLQKPEIVDNKLDILIEEEKKKQEDKKLQ